MDSRTHITRDICFLGRETHVTGDMCFLGKGTHITRDNLCVSWVGIVSLCHDFISL